MTYAPSHIAQRRRVWRSDIATLEATVMGDASPIRMGLPESRASRRLYFCAVLDDCPQWAVFSEIVFSLRGSELLKIPVNLTEFGIGGYQSVSDDVCLPSWSVQRKPFGSYNTNADNFTLNSSQPGPDSLQSAWYYYDGVNYWDYIAVMSPFRILGSFDQVQWRCRSLTGTVFSTWSFLAITLAVVSE